MESKILAAIISSRKNWNLVSPYIKKEELSAEGTVLYGIISGFYELDQSASHVDADILVNRIVRSVPSEKHVEVLKGYLTQILSEDVSTINVVAEVLDTRAHALGLQIAGKLASGKPESEVRGLLEEWQALKDGKTSLGGGAEFSEEEFHEVSPEALAQKHFSKDNLIEVWPRALNDMIDGGAKPGHHILVFAPTEMGKTLMVINMVAGFLKAGHKVLYVGNEDPAPDILMRMMTRLTGMTKYEIQENPKAAQRLLDGRNWSKFVLASLAPGTFGQIQALVEKHQPAVVVLDQLRNLNVDSENRTQALEKAATSARNLAKRNNVLVVSVSQAADSASRKTILDRGDVDGSNVGIPGQCDLMIGIGADPAMEEAGYRTLSFPKNKLSGRHTPIPVQFNYALSRVEG